MNFEAHFVKHIAEDMSTEKLLEEYYSPKRGMASSASKENVDEIIKDELKERGCVECESDLLFDGEEDEFYCPICDYDFERR